MKEPEKRPKPKYYTSPGYFWVARFDNTDGANNDTIAKWFNQRTKKWDESMGSRWTFRALRAVYPEIIEIPATQQLIRTGLP